MSIAVIWIPIAVIGAATVNGVGMSGDVKSRALPILPMDLSVDFPAELKATNILDNIVPRCRRMDNA